MTELILIDYSEFWQVSASPEWNSQLNLIRKRESSNGATVVQKNFDHHHAPLIGRMFGPT
jgi:hypothetical protein